jgi:hypothetical protein
LLDRAWLLNWTCYGTWLPGDRRGFVGFHNDANGFRVNRNEPNSETAREIAALRKYAAGPDDIDPESVLHSFKSYASRRLNRVYGTREWWTKSGSTRKLPNETAIRAAVRYVKDRPGALCVRYDVRWLPLTASPDLASPDLASPASDGRGVARSPAS